MYIVFRVGCRDQKDQSHGFPVQGIKVNTVLHDHGRQAGSVNRVTFSVRNGDSFTDSCGALLLPCIYLLSVGLLVIDLTALCHQSDHLVKCLLLAFWGTIQGNTSLVQ